jgi:Arc/MetJ family transcription regulator
MPVSKVSLSLDEEVLDEARRRVGKRELSSYVSSALRRQLQHDRLRDLLQAMDDESGPVPPETLDAARELWRS